MKTRTFLFVVSILFISFGCKKLNINKELRIDVGTQFQNDLVIIKLDNNVVFSDSVSTNHILGVSEIITFDYPIGKYEISVSVNGIEKTDKFRHKKNRFIYIYHLTNHHLKLTSHIRQKNIITIRIYVWSRRVCDNR